MDLGKLMVRYGVDTSELSTAEAKLNTTFGRIKDAAMSGAGMIAGAAGLGGVVWTAKSVVENFANFEDAMQKVRVVSGATGEEFAKLSELARDMATKTEYSAAQIAQGMYELSSAGMNAAQQMEIMPSVLDLATAGGIEMSQAAEMVVKSLAGFNMEAGEATHVTDVMAMAVNKSMLHFEDLRLSMQYIAPVAGATNQSLEDMTAALAIMSNAGIRGEQAGTTLRGAFVRLMDPTKEVNEGLAKLGLTADQINPSTQKLGEILAVVAEHSSGLDDATRNQALSMIFGTEALSGMLALVNAGPDALEELSSSFEGSAGTAKDSASKMRESFSKQWEILKNKFMDVAMDLAQALMPVLDGVTRFIDAIGGARNALILLGSAWAGLKLASWAGAFSSLGATAAAEVGTQLSAAAAQTGAAAMSLGRTIASYIGGGLAAGIAGFSIGSMIGQKLVEGANAPAAIKTYVDASDTVLAGIQQQETSLAEFGAAHRAAIVQAGSDLNALAREYMSFGMGIEEAKDVAVAAMLDQGLAIEGLRAQLQELYQEQIDAEQEIHETPQIDAIKRKIIELQALSGQLPGMVAGALASLDAIPDQVLAALQSTNPQVLAAGQQSMALYAAGLGQMAGLPVTQAQQTGNQIAWAFSSSDPTVRQNAANTIAALVNSLRANGVLPAQEAEAIKNQINTALDTGTTPVTTIWNTLQGIIDTIKSKGGEAVSEAGKVGSGIHHNLIQAASPDISYKVPAVYDVMFDKVDSIFARRIPNIDINLGRFPMPTPTQGVPGAAIEHHWHIGTLIADDRSMEELARKMRFNYIPRISRAMGG